VTVAARLDSLARLREYVMRAARDLDRATAYRLRLAVDEIATNAIVHGCADTGQEGILRIRADSDEKAVRIILEDSGRPYDPRETLPPDDLARPLEERQVGGLGVFLALRGVDEFRYERVGAWNRNVFIVKRKTARTADA
jgi:serine/threonine-protein kinase RsbW